jgi:drug/metabolite transporter (DMT)-like permease
MDTLPSLPKLLRVFLMHSNRRAVITSLLAPLFLGMAPILGKLSINAGADSFTVAAWRTAVAVVFLWVVYALFARRYIYIYPAGLFGCIIVGVVNGIGSLFYYSGLSMIDASLAQLLNGMYLIFVVLLSHLGGERIDRRIAVRVAMATMALFIIAGFGKSPPNWLGVGLMLANALMFAGTVILSQYVLYEMPAPTVTLYALTTMGVVVAVVWIAVGKPMPPDVFQNAVPPIIVLAITTAASRVALFSGVKLFGSLQTAILALTEIGVALALAFFILGDRLTPSQVAGVALLAFSILLIRSKDILPRGINPNQLFYNIADIQFQWIAFDQAFGKPAQLGETHPTSPKLLTTEIQAIRKMMGVSSGAVRPIEIKNSSDVVLQDMLLVPVAKTRARFSVYYPATLKSETWQPVRAYVFREQAADSVLEDVREQLPGQDSTRLWTESSIELTEGALVTAVLLMEGIESNPSSISRRFDGDWQRFDFYLKTNGAAAASAGKLNITVGGKVVTGLVIGWENTAPQ